MLSSGDQRAIFYVIESNEPRDCDKLVTFVLRHHVVKVTYSVFQPAMSKKGTIFSSRLNQRIEMLRRLDETHRVEQGACWWAKRKWQVSNDSKQTKLQSCMGEWNSGDLVDILNTVREAPKDEFR